MFKLNCTKLKNQSLISDKVCHVGFFSRICCFVPQTVLALWGPGSLIRLVKVTSLPRASACTQNVARTIGFTTFSTKENVENKYLT